MNAHTSVVMVSYRTGPVLWLAVESVLQQTECLELILVDNGNPPDVGQRITEMAKNDPRIIYISGQGNVGFAVACNLGAKRATGEYILLLNPDCVLPELALSRCADALSIRPDAMMAGCFLSNLDGTEQRGGRRQLLSPLNGVLESIGLSRLVSADKKFNLNQEVMPTDVHDVPAISGSFMFMRRRDYITIGGMDEHYFLHMEDMDFCYRVSKTGKRIICIPTVKVLHYRSTSDVGSAFVEWQKTKGFIRYFYTHFKDAYFPGVLALLSLGIVMRFPLKLFSMLISPFVRPEAFQDKTLRKSILLKQYSQTQPLHNYFKDRSFIVTGASSQVGICVVGRLLASGSKVTAYTKQSTLDFSHPNLTWKRADMTARSLEAVANAHILIHTGPIWLLNGTIESLRDIGIKRIVAFSSTSVEGKANSSNAYEKSLVESLMQAEDDLKQQCNAAHITWTILRPTLVYGLGVDNNIARIAKTIRLFGVFPVYGKARGMRQPVHADDLAIAALQCAINQATQDKIYNVSGGSEIAYADMVEEVARALGRKLRLFRPPFMPKLLDLMGVLYGAKHVTGDMARRMNEDLVFDHEAAARDFGYNPRAFRVTSEML